MSKEEIIREAYGEYWEEIKEYVKDNGWCNCMVANKLALSGNQEDSDCGYYVRPKALQGIEHNNGWIKIENEADLPKENCDVMVVFKNGEIDCQRYLFEYKNFSTHHYKHITHYQLITKPKPPIY